MWEMQLKNIFGYFAVLINLIVFSVITFCSITFRAIIVNGLAKRSEIVTKGRAWSENPKYRSFANVVNVVKMLYFDNL